MFSWIVVFAGVAPEIPVPYTVVLAEFPSGVRIPGNMPGDSGPDLRVGARVEAAVASRDGRHTVVFSLADDE